MNRAIEHRRPRSCRSGFTLAEIIVCCVLLALGFVGILAAYGNDTVASQRSEDVTYAGFLADEIRTMAQQMTFANVLALGGAPYSPAILSTGVAQDVSTWSQTVVVTPVTAADLNTQVAPASATVARLTVTVKKSARTAIVQTYYIFKMDAVPFTDGGTGH